MSLIKLLKRGFFLLAYYCYAKHKLQRNDHIELFGFSLDVPPTVFHPNLYFSSKILGEHVLNLELNGKTVLDMGCGSGLLSLAAASKGASVTSVDINPAAVRATITNAARNNLTTRINVLEGNLFSVFQQRQLFSYIFLNPPFYRGNPTDYTSNAWYGGKEDNFLKDFTLSVSEYLSSNGMIILIISSEMDIHDVKEIFSNQSLTLKCVAGFHRLFEKLYIYYAFRSS